MKKKRATQPPPVQHLTSTSLTGQTLGLGWSSADTFPSLTENSFQHE